MFGLAFRLWFQGWLFSEELSVAGEAVEMPWQRVLHTSVKNRNGVNTMECNGECGIDSRSYRVGEKYRIGYSCVVGQRLGRSDY